MYQVLCDNLPLFDLRDENLVLQSPKVDLQDNSAGSFEFTIFPKHPYYDSIQKMKSVIQVMDNEEEIFCGRVIDESIDFHNRKKVVCEGELAFFNDSIQRPAVYHNQTVRAYLQTLITIHNSQVDESKQFQIGSVTVVDNNDSLYKYTNWESTMQVIKTDLLDTYGGHLRIRKVNGIRYLDYLQDYPNTNTQVIEFGKNLLDFTKGIDVQDIATAVIPLGAKQEESAVEGLEERLTIASVNSGVDFVYSESAVKTYGWIYKTVTFDDVNVPANLKRKGEQYLADIQFENVTLDVQAVDLHMMDVDIERIKMLDEIRVVSEPNGLDRFFPVTKMSICIDTPSKNKITLGQTVSSGMTGSASSANTKLMKQITDIPSAGSIVKEAVDNATALIHSALNGHVVITENADELLIMDTDDIKTARKVWRWNLNGLGYSSTGYDGTYETAITMDGQIVGSRLVGNSVSAEKLEVSYKSSVEKKISDAESNAEDYTDSKLTGYWTRVQVETAIKNTKDSIIISAQETAEDYTDNKLKSYYTKAQIDVKTNSIESTVSKKLNSSELSTKIQQNATAVRIAWNNCSRYIQFENSELCIYDYSNYKLMTLNSSGCWYYRDGITIGKIGTNSWSGDSSFKGLVFDLESQAKYMCWSSKETPTANTYTVRLIYYQDSSKYKRGLHFSCPTYANGNLYLSDNYRLYQYSDGSVGYDGAFYFRGGAFIQNYSEFGLYGGTRFVAYNNVSIDFYSGIDMHGYSISNQSDARMKKNIQPTKVEALKILNAFDLKEFDWVQGGSHEDIGIIAQQLQLIAPDLVQEEKDGHLSIKTTKFIFYLIKAIQELSGEGYEKVPWSDPYTLLEKAEFCAKLEQSNPTERKDKDKLEPEIIQIPIKK